jgi:hypothetical protein
MSNRRSLFVLLPCVCLTTLAHSLGAMTLEYSTTASALAEGGWIDPYFGDIIATPVADSREAAGGRSYADAYWDEIKYAGKLDINIAASATTDPNLIVLTTELSGSFRSEVGTPLFTYFYQLAEGTIAGLLHIDEFPPGTPCSLHFQASWPQDTWTGDYYWRLEIVSDVEWIECGYGVAGPYGPRSGSVTAIAGEPVHLFLGTLGEGLYQIGAANALGVGRIQLDVELTVTRHIADLHADGFVNFEDFAVFARQWRCSAPGPDEIAGHTAADFDGSGAVDVGDLQWLAHYWLLSPRPPAGGEAGQ